MAMKANETRVGRFRSWSTKNSFPRSEARFSSRRGPKRKTLAEERRTTANITIVPRRAKVSGRGHSERPSRWGNACAGSRTGFRP